YLFHSLSESVSHAQSHLGDVVGAFVSVNEVDAVADHEFQRKCIGYIEFISESRTYGQIGISRLFYFEIIYATFRLTDGFLKITAVKHGEYFSKVKTALTLREIVSRKRRDVITRAVVSVSSVKILINFFAL